MDRRSRGRFDVRDDRAERSPVVDAVEAHRLGRTPSLSIACAALVAAVLALLACSGGESGPEQATPAGTQPTPEAREVRRERGLDVLLVTIDTLRADALGAYGNPVGATPWMDRLAAAGVVFENARAHNVVTLPSHASILSGLHPQTHGVRDNSGFRFPADVATLATRLKAEGYRTAAFVSAFPLDSRFGLARGFDLYDDSFVGSAVRPSAFLEQERPGTETVELARRWLDVADERPSFAWVHLYEPHFPYAPPTRFAERFSSDPYLGDVAAADAALAPLLEPLVAAGDRGRTLLILTSDHGESLGEHGETTHGIFGYEGALRVPLVIFQPRLLLPRRVTQPARLVDVFPTVLDALSLSVPDDLDGGSLLPVAAGVSEERPRDTYFEALSGQLNRGWAPLYGVVSEGWKYIDLPLPELFELTEDPEEEQNRVESEPARVERMQSLLAKYREADAGVRPTSEGSEIRDRLRSLGYLGAPSPLKARYGEEDDPKRLIGLESKLQEIASLYERGELEEARRLCRELTRRRPGMRVALMMLGQIERDVGNLEAAVEAMEAALELHPTDTTALAVLASYLTQAGRPHDAAALTEAELRQPLPDLDVLLARSLALARSGRLEAAFGALEEAQEIDPDNPAVAVYRGTLYLMSGRRGEARAAYQDALALNAGTVRAHTALAIMATEEGAIEDAIAHWKQAVALDSREYEKLLSVAIGMWEAGERPHARRLLELFQASAPPDPYGQDLERVRTLLTTRRQSP